MYCYVFFNNSLEKYKQDVDARYTNVETVFVEKINSKLSQCGAVLINLKGEIWCE